MEVASLMNVLNLGVSFESFCAMEWQSSVCVDSVSILSQSDCILADGDWQPVIERHDATIQDEIIRRVLMEITSNHLIYEKQATFSYHAPECVKKSSLFCGSSCVLSICVIEQIGA